MRGQPYVSLALIFPYFITTLLLLSFHVIQAQDCGCVECPQTIPVFDADFTIDYNVVGLTNDDLAGTQCVAGVNIQFAHNRLQNLAIELISPSGQVVPLIGPILPFGGGLNGTFGATWNVNFVQCFPNGLASPDPLVGEVWYNLDPGWSIFGGVFSGTYYPTEGNCLDNFNIGTANGTWQLRVVNAGFPPVSGDGIIEDFSITFCDETGAGCCAADGGALNINPITACEGDESLQFSVEPFEATMPPDTRLYDYQFFVLSNDTIIDLQDEIDLRDYEAGQYEIVGLSYQWQDSITFQTLNNRLFSDLATIDACFNTSTDRVRIEILEVPDTIQINRNICLGDSLVIGNNTFTDRGDYTITALAQNGCDSIIQLTLNIFSPDTTFIEVEICEGETYTFGANTLTVSGDYVDTLTSMSGCDSLVRLNLAVLSAFETELSAEICEGETYTFGANTLTTSGNYADTLTSMSGCDSLIRLDLAVLSAFETELSAEICEGETYTFGANTLTVSGNYFDTLTSVSGCDSLVRLNLAVLSAFETELSAEICEGESYTFGTNTLTVSGNYVDTLTSMSGCDSLVRLDLVVLSAFETELSAEICEGETYTFGANILTTSGNYADTLTSMSGCDSLVRLNLVVLSAFETELLAEICEGETYTFGANTLTTSGNYVDTLTSMSGCDSLVRLNLAVLSAFETGLSAEICEGETYTFGANTLTVSGNYVDTLTSMSGCDSLVRLNLVVLSAFETELLAEICEGETYTFGANTLTTSGNYVDTLTSMSGCDSLVRLNLAVLSAFETGLSAEICEGEIYTFGANTLTVSGNYIDTLTSVSGCDSLVRLELEVINIDAEIAIQLPACGTSNLADIQVSNITGGSSPYLYAIDSAAFSAQNKYELAAGMYSIRVQDINGCEWDTTFSIPTLDTFTIDLGDDIIIEEGESTQIEVQTNQPIAELIWQSSNNDSIGCLNCPIITIQPELPTIYSVEATDENGCTATDQVAIFIRRTSNVYIPTAFSPNADGINDDFTIFFKEERVEAIDVFQIFDRWGNLLFQTNESNTFATWDGRYKGELLNAGVYIYSIELRLSDDRIERYSGEILLIK